jgi:hypothetical protein
MTDVTKHHVWDRPADIWLWRSNATGAHERLNLTLSFDTLASPAARPRLPRNRHGVSPVWGICRAVPSTHIPGRQLPQADEPSTPGDHP